MAKVVYLIQTYKNPAQIERLVQTIKRSSPTAFVLISHNFLSTESDYLDAAVVEKFSNVKVMSGRGGRGDFCLVHGYLNAVDWLLNWGVEFDWLVNLTGQDYPTQPLTRLEQLLDTTEYDGFLEGMDAIAHYHQNEWCRTHIYPRYFYQYWQSGGYLRAWQRLALKLPAAIINTIIPGIHIYRSYGLMVGRYCKNSPFNQNKLRCYAGSYFHLLSRNCIKYLRDYSRSHPEIIRYYENTCIPDESFIQSVLMSSQQFNFCQHHLRYIDWAGSRHGRPKILTMDDYTKLLQDDIFFARKFDLLLSQNVLDRLDQRIFAQQTAAALTAVTD